MNSSDSVLLKEYIYNKQRTDPIFPDITRSRITTQINHTPYTKWYQGSIFSESPIFHDRNAGFFKTQQSVRKVLPVDVRPINVCFQRPCNTVLPCNTQFQQL